MSEPLKGTQLERLTRIETLLETAFSEHGPIQEMRADIKTLRADFELDKADLATLKNRGVGILIGVGLISSVFGMTVAGLWERVTKLFA